jgi:hypothetical protein
MTSSVVFTSAKLYALYGVPFSLGRTRWLEVAHKTPTLGLDATRSPIHQLAAPFLLYGTGIFVGHC